MGRDKMTSMEEVARKGEVVCNENTIEDVFAFAETITAAKLSEDEFTHVLAANLAKCVNSTEIDIEALEFAKTLMDFLKTHEFWKAGGLVANSEMIIDWYSFELRMLAREKKRIGA